MTTPAPPPSHEEIQELLGVYALDAVDPETAAMVELHLEECVRCSIEVAQHHEVAGLLANSGGESPAGLWNGIASRLDGAAPPDWEELASQLEPVGDQPDRLIDPGNHPTRPSGDPAPGPDAVVVPITAGRRRNRSMAAAATLVAVAAAVVAIVLGAQVNHLNHNVSSLRANAGVTAAEQAALALPTTKKVRLAPLSTSTGASAPQVTVVLTEAGTGFVQADRLASLPADKTYQLWGVIGHRTISLGLLGSSPSVVPFSVAGGVPVSAFAITAEHSGGVVQSANQPVVAGQVT